MNKLIIILFLLFLLFPLFGNAQIGLLLRPLSEEAPPATATPPNQISDLDVWIRPDTLVTLSGSTITDLKEIVSGSSFDFASGSPQLSGDHVVFSGSQYLYWGGSIPSTLTGSAITYVIVYDPGNANEFMMAGNDLTSISVLKPSGGYAELSVSAASNNGNITFASGWTDKSVVIIRAPDPKTTSTVEMRINDTAISVSSTSGSSAIDEPLNLIALGVSFDYTGGGNTIFATGDFYELMIYDRILTSQEETELLNYLYNRYSITP